MTKPELTTLEWIADRVTDVEAERAIHLKANGWKYGPSPFGFVRFWQKTLVDGRIIMTGLSDACSIQNWIDREVLIAKR